MSVSVEKLEKSMIRLTIEVSAEDFDKAINKVYNRQKSRMNVPGFRKGKTPRKVLEKMPQKRAARILSPIPRSM